MNNTYEYKRHMRDGSIKLMTGVIRSRAKKKKTKENNHGN